jgi:O-antigen ligase
MGGFRPMVFMQHGLAVGFWMTAASLIGVWLLVTGSLRQVLGVPMMVIVPVLLVTTVLCKSVAGIGFLFGGIAVLFLIKWTKTALPLYLLLAVAPVYMVVRASGMVDGTQLIQLATDVFGEERAQSLATRINSENALSAHALERPLFGYGRYSPNSRRPLWMPTDAETGKRTAIPDGMWVLTMAQRGVLALAALTAMVLLPPLLLRTRVGPQWWAHPMAAPAAACAVLLTLHMADNLLNAMVNPLFICIMGGLAGLGTHVVQRRGFPVQQQQMPYGYQQQMPGGPRRPIAPPPPNRPISTRPAHAGR